MLYRASLPYTADAAVYYAAIADMPWAVWLDSAGLARYDILCAQPASTLVTRATDTEITDALGVRHSGDDPFGLIRQQLGEPDGHGKYAAPDDKKRHARSPLSSSPPEGERGTGSLREFHVNTAVPGVPFSGGALGYWGYDLARRMMALPAQAENSERLPDMAIGIYDWAVVLDHQEKSAQLVSQQRFAETKNELAGILERLRRAGELPADTFSVQGSIASNFTPDSYAAAFAQVRDYLRAGDCYQINLAQRFRAAATGDAFGAYRTLRRLNPAPYSAFLGLPQAQILCASPEHFLRVRNGCVETEPIKGTRPRSGDVQQDRKLADELRNHPKDRAENLMIVDLLRNDLGKNCVPGSVRVPKLFELKSFADVHHLVSTVEGKLEEGRDALHVLRDCFPGGSITGAPKLRAMQIIGQLEPNHRGLYCGAIGYVGFDGNMDSNIVIRTLIHSGKEIECWVGGGIVADSEVAAEYQETLDKAAGALKLLRQYGGEWGSGSV